MSFKTTYMLFGLLVGILVIFIVSLVQYDETQGEASRYVLAALHDKASPVKQDDITEIVIERSDPAEKIVLTRDAEAKRWKITEPRTLRADRFAVNDLLRQIFDARREEKFDRTGDLKSLGLDPPRETVTLKEGDKREVVLRIGETTPGETSAVIYVASGAKPTEAMAVKKSQLDSVLKKLNDFRERDLLTGSESDIQSVALSIDGKKGPVALKKIEEGKWRFTEPAYGDADVEGQVAAPSMPGAPPGQSGGVRGLLRDLANLKVDYKDASDNDFVAENVEDFAQYHLDPAKAEVLSIAIDRKDDGEKITPIRLLVGVSKKAEGAGDKFYARRADEDSVVKVPAATVDAVRKLLDDPATLRDRTLVHFASFKTPDAVDVQHGATKLEFRKPENKPWQMYRGGDASTPTDDAAVQGLINLLTQKNQIKSFPELDAKEAALGLDKPSAVVSLWTEGLTKDEKAEEKKEDGKDEKAEEKKYKPKSTRPKLKEPEKPTVRLTFGRIETDKQGQKLVNVKREAGGETTLARVPVHILERVQDGPLAYMDRSLPHFNDGKDAGQDVVKLELFRGGSVVEVARAKEGEPWKFTKPSELAGRNVDAAAIDNILNSLNSLRATRLVAEKAKDDAELEKEYGLKSPALRAVVTLQRDGKATPHEFLLGKELDDKMTQFAKLGGRDLIFTVERGAIASLQKSDLLDPVVLKFDVAKVQSLKLTGWKNLGVSITLEFERKGESEWTAKMPAGFNLDAGKIRTLLDDLASLRAERFVTRDMKLKAAFESKVKAGLHVLEVAVVLEGEKDAVTLTVANLDVAGDKEDEKLAGDRGIYATTNRVAGEIFQVRKGIFDGPMTKPGYFSP